MKTLLIAIGLPITTLVLASSDNYYAGYPGLQSRGLNWQLLRRSPTDKGASSSRVPGRRKAMDAPEFKGFQRSRETAIKSLSSPSRDDKPISVPNPSKDDRPTPVPKLSQNDRSVPVPRKYHAVGVIQASHPARGYMIDGLHGEWETNPKPGIPSMAKIKHNESVCVGGSCREPRGVLTTDVIGDRITTNIDSRAGGTVHIADHENINATPQWRSYGPGKKLTVITTGKNNLPARHHARLEGAGRIAATANMNLASGEAPPEGVRGEK